MALAKKLSLAGDSGGKEEKHASKYASKNDKLDLAVSTATLLLLLVSTDVHVQLLCGVQSLSENLYIVNA
jgi:hypothetical protein